MAYGERLLEHDNKRTQQIGEGLLRSQGDGQTADPESGQHRVGRQPDAISASNQDGNRHDDCQ